VTRNSYIAALLRLYLDAPDTPRRAARADRRLAAELYRQGVSPEHFAHAIRLATLRRRHRSHPPIQSLAYYRAVLQRLSQDELKPDYLDYVRDAHLRLRLSSEPRPDSHNPALSGRR
jgi:hypothetical protein